MTRGQQMSSYLQIWIWNWDIVVFPLILCKQLEPTAYRTSEDLADAEWERSHEIIPGRPVPVPHLHRQTPVPLTASHWAEETQNSNSSGEVLSFIWLTRRKSGQNHILNKHNTSQHIYTFPPAFYFHLGLNFAGTHKVKLSFQTGLSVERMVFVFCLLWLFGSGISFSFTYGSDKPFGSMGIRLRASRTAGP